jgi:hypothetical protein
MFETSNFCASNVPIPNHQKSETLKRNTQTRNVTGTPILLQYN